jgi:hypothetical protein
MKNWKKLTMLFFVPLVFIQCHYDFFLSFSPDNVLKNPNFSWYKDSTKHAKYYYSPNSLAAWDIEQIKDTTEKSIIRILILLHEDDYKERIHFFIVESKERMKELINTESNGAANWKYNGVYYVYGASLKSLGPHEFHHVIAVNLWGNGHHSRWVGGGFAGYADNHWQKYDLHSLCKYLLMQNKLIPIEKLDTSFSEYNDLITYPESASFVKYLYEVYGWEKIKMLWKDGSEQIPTIYGKKLIDLEKEWLEKIKKSNSMNIDYKL